MKTLALSATALAIAMGSLTAPAFAVDHGNQQNVDSQIVSISGNTATLANGFTVDAPRAASAGDKVRVVLTENNDLKRVFILN
jgi:predicted RNA-binding protein with TRAM domain